nr:hypothetical protein [Mycobacterium sp. E735]
MDELVTLSRRDLLATVREHIYLPQVSEPPAKRAADQWRGSNVEITLT